MKRITYIITHKNSTADRESNLLCILDWLNNIEEIEKVIIVEQDDKPKIPNIASNVPNTNYKLEYRFLENSNTFFNKCWAFNYGAKLANTEWLAFGDNDVFMDIQSINNSIKIALDNYDSFTPYETVYDLTPRETEIIKESKEYKDLNKKTNSIRGGAPYGGGIFFIRRDSFFEIGAWDEGFINWGAEDEDITHRIKNNLNFLSVGRNAYHLHHERILQTTHKNENYNNNIQIFISKRSKPLKEIMKDFDINEIGLEDKYSK
jgi:predicted glycosyltransferase involved in capsule biosynthesis